jgi:hypothetical protein
MPLTMDVNIFHTFKIGCLQAQTCCRLATQKPKYGFLENIAKYLLFADGANFEVVDGFYVLARPMRRGDKKCPAP